MRVNFNQLFEIQNGMISPKVQVHINGTTMSPGISFGGGVAFGGIDLSQFVGMDFDVEIQNGIYIIKGVFN